MRWRNFFSRGRIRENCNLYRHGHGSSRRGPRGRPGPARGSAAESSRVRACIAVRRYRSRVQLQAQHRTLICEPSISQQTLTEPGPPPPSAPSLSAPSPSEEDKGRGTDRGQECQSGDAATGLEVKRRNMSPTPPYMSDAHGRAQASGWLYALWWTAAPPAVQGAAQSREPVAQAAGGACTSRACARRVGRGLAALGLLRALEVPLDRVLLGRRVLELLGRRASAHSRSQPRHLGLQAGCRVAGALRCMARGAPSAPVVIGGQVHVDTHEALLA